MCLESNEACKRIIDTRFHEDMLEALNWDTLSAVGVCLSDSKLTFVTELMVTLHSVVRKAETARSAFRKCQAVHVLQKFRHVTENLVIGPICIFASRFPFNQSINQSIMIFSVAQIVNYY